MIGKSGTGGSFRGLANYLEGEEKIDFKEVRNLAGDHKDHYVRMMEDTASLSRAEKPVYHLSISYAREDHPSREAMIQDADRLLEKMELDDHQAVIICHKDKHHPHLHLMVNRVHPEKGKAWNPWNDRQKYRREFRQIEADRGYSQLLDMDRQSPKISLSQGEYQQFQEYGLGKAPLKIKADFYELDTMFDEADRWEDVRWALSDLGLKITRKGRGGVIEEVATGKQLKLSRVGRAYSFGKLEKRFGSYRKFEKALEAHKDLNKYLPDKEIRQAFGRFAREMIGGKAARKNTKKMIKNSLSKSFKIGKVAAGLGRLATSPNPLAGAAKLGVKMARRIASELTKSQEIDRGR